MKKFKVLTFLLLMVITLFIGKHKGNALTISNIPDSIKISSQGRLVTSVVSENFEVKAFDSWYDFDFEANGNPVFPVKHYDGPYNGQNDVNNVYCTSGLATAIPSDGMNCNKTAWENEKDAYAVGYIIQKLHGKTDFTRESYEQYYWTELMINAYLGSFTGQREDGSKYSLTDNYMSESATNKILNIDTYSNILSSARSYANGNAGSQLELSVSSTELNFKDGEDGYYYSDFITINSNGSFEIDMPEIITYTNQQGKYQFKIKKEDIENIGTNNFSITINGSRTDSYAQRYECGSYQKVTPAVVYEDKKTKSVTLTGSITRDEVNLGIVKIDQSGKIIEGSKFLLQTKEQKEKGIRGIEIVPGSAGAFTPALSSGVYYLTELEAPEGYNKYKGYIKIEIDNTNGTGKIIVDGKEISNNIIKVKNTQTETKFSKISVVNKKELPGATLRILDENKEVLLDKEGNPYEWVSTNEPHYIYGLPIGKYYLQEVLAPEGYSISEETVEFEVKGDGSITEVVMENALEVEVPDTLSSRSVLLLFIGMIDIALGIGILLYVKKNKITE